MAQIVLDEIPAAVAQADNLPSVPGVALEILRLSRDEDAGIEDYADVLSRDPALAAKLLKLSNSSMFSMGQSVTTVQQATMVLGMKTVQLMSLSFSMTTAVGKNEVDAAFDFAQYWRRSLIASVAGRAFCKLVNVSASDEAFMCGLLSNIGKLVMVQCLPEHYTELLADSEGWPSIELEREKLGYDNAALGGALLRSWELPEMICLVINYMNDPDELPEEIEGTSRALTDVMHLASLAVRILCDEDKGEPFKRLHELTAKRGIPEQRIDSFLVDLEAGINETADLLDLEVNSNVDYAAVVDQARQQMVQISLGTAASLQRSERRNNHLENENRDLAAKASTDKLTGLANRAGFDAVLEKELNSRKNEDVPNSLGLLIIDVDKFKNFNDTYGHQAGDEVLRIVGAVMQKLTRESDLPARYGGEEFAVIVPQTSPFALKCYAERIRKEIEGTPLPIDGQTVSITASIGGACLSKASDAEGNATELIETADKNLYRCKEGGRNRVEVEAEPLSFR